MTTKYECISMNAWPSLQWLIDEGWVLRFSKGYTKRANSVIPIFGSETNFSQRLQRVEKKYKSKNLPTIFKLTDEFKELDDFLSNRGYKKIGLTSFQTVSLNEVNLFKTSKYQVLNKYNKQWFDCFVEFSNLSKNNAQVLNEMLKNTPMNNYYFLISNDESIVGCGLGVVEERYFGIFDIYINKAYQGQGFGKKLLKAMLNYGKELSLETAYLQVVDENTIAKSLYQSLGFKEEYKYWYRKKE